MFGDRLRKLRKEHKLTQKELGEKVSVSSRVIGYYESNERFPDKETLIALAEYFQVSLDYLLCRNDNRNNIDLNDNEYLYLIKDINSLNEDSKKQIKEFIQFVKLRESSNENKRLSVSQKRSS